MVTNSENYKTHKNKLIGVGENSKDKITEQIELLTELMKVTSAVKKNITQDYPLSWLNKDEREFIVENYQNAEYAKDIVDRFGKKGFTYEWDDKKMDWVRDEEGHPKKVILTEKERLYVTLLAKRIFEFFMVKPHMIAILNRNRSENFMVKLLGKAPEEEQTQPIGQLDEKGFFSKLKDKMGGQQVEYVEE